MVICWIYWQQVQGYSGNNLIPIAWNILEIVMLAIWFSNSRNIKSAESQNANNFIAAWDGSTSNKDQQSRSKTVSVQCYFTLISPWRRPDTPSAGFTPTTSEEICPWLPTCVFFWIFFFVFFYFTPNFSFCFLWTR